MAVVLKFAYDVIGATMDEVSTKLDDLVRQNVFSEGGEPWISIVDRIEKQVLSEVALLNGDPSGHIYYGTRQVVFAGPTKYGKQSEFRDGFRPQEDLDNSP